MIQCVKYIPSRINPGEIAVYTHKHF